MASYKVELRRRQLKAQYGEMFDATAALLFRHDPIGINFEDNTDEYEPEALTILPRLRDGHSEADVCRVVHEEFIRWFGPETAKIQEHYAQIAREIWALSLKHNASELRPDARDGVPPFILRG